MARMLRKAAMPKESPAIDQELIRELAALLAETGLSEIEIEQHGLRIRVVRQFSAPPAAVPMPSSPMVAAPTSVTVAPAAAALDPDKHPGTVVSPMVGTAYLAPEPGAKPYVDIGSVVQAGETLLIIEAMKTMNQIPAPRPGTVIQILVEDGEPVEFGAPLMIIE
jgi:acetyl-CoA carboxylase biotin carboxyl carrier protein